MIQEYRTSITVTKSSANGDIYKKSFNGTCAVGLNKRNNGSIAQKAAAYLQAVEKSLGNGMPVLWNHQSVIFSWSILNNESVNARILIEFLFQNRRVVN